jgi:hypothetical protein
MAICNRVYGVLAPGGDIVGIFDGLSGSGGKLVKGLTGVRKYRPHGYITNTTT